MTWDPDPTQRREPLTAAWTPGAPPVDAETVLRSTLPPAPPPPRPSPARRRGTAWVVAAVVLLLLGLGTGVGVAMSGGDDDATAPVAGGTSPVARTSAAPDPSTSAPATPATTTAATTSVPPTAAVTSQPYGGAGGLTVSGPAGWVADASAANPNINDYRAPASPARLAGPTFRLGIGNVAPSGTYASEAAQAAQFQLDQYQATILAGPTYTTFLGTTAADIEYTYFNTKYGVQRRGIERIWRSGSVTLIIQSSDFATNWPVASAVFQQLVASAQVG